MPLPHDEDTPPWVYQEPETPWISTEQDTQATIPQQVPLPPIQVSPSREKTNMSTGDSIIPHPPWFDETPQPSSTIHEDGSPPVPSFDETPFVTAPVPETPTIPSVAKRWRSGALHPVPETPNDSFCGKTLAIWNTSSRESCIEALAIRYVASRDSCSDHSASTASVARRCYACCASISKTPRHTIRSSERVKRSRLAPAQVMSTAVAKHCDWSLGFDERGPVFDGTQDWRHSVFLTGRAARKEVYFASESPANQRVLLAAMEGEWKKSEEHMATLPLTQGEMRMLKSRFPNLKIVGTRWVLTPKEPDFKARLVVQSCQEDPSMMRTDSPTGSRDSFLGSFMRSTGTLELWFCRCRFCILASRRNRTIALAHGAKTSPGCERGEVRVARGSIYGTRDAGRSWYQHFRDRLANKSRVHESALEKGLNLYEFNGQLTFVTVTQVDNLFYAYDTRCKTTKSLLDAIVKEFNSVSNAGRYCFLWQTRSCDTRSFDRQPRTCGLISCSDGIVWNPTIR